VIDCEKLNKAKSDADVINELAYQTGTSLLKIMAALT
jgi:hypothetical protein